MSFLAPAFLLAGLGAAAVVVALHLFAWRRPPAYALPTARFVPDRPARARSRQPRPEDVPLMLLRVLLLALVATAFAGPVRRPERRPVRQVILVDRSAVAADSLEAAERVRQQARAGDWVIAFDSAPSRPALVGRDSLPRLGGAGGQASLSAALAAAVRITDSLVGRADSAALVIVSPLAAGAFDQATPLVRQAWTGRAMLVPLRRRAGGDTARTGVTVRAAGDDALAAAVALLPGADERPAGARLVRDTPGAADSAFARDGGRLVDWPADGRPAAWVARPRRDTLGALVVGGWAAVLPLARVATAPAGARVVARWVDGEPAAIERPLGSGCVREVGAVVPTTGDAALQPSVGRAVAALLGAPCGGPPERAASDSQLRMLAGSGPQLALAAAGGGPARSAAAPWLLGAAIALALVELLVRRGRAAEDA